MNITKKYKLIFLITLFFALFGWAEKSGAATINAASCAQADVQSAVDSASEGDIISVPACAETIWSAPLVIVKPIALQGAGIDLTMITANFVNVSSGLIRYAPTTPDSGHRFRISGFTLNNGGGTHSIYLFSASATPEYPRIDHNKITMQYTTHGTTRGIYVHGSFYGVADSNVFYAPTRGPMPILCEGHGDGNIQWDNLPRNYGTIENFYEEDNLYTGNLDMLQDSGTGGRWVHRYNTYNAPITGGTIPGIAGGHGNQPGGQIGAGTGGNSGTMIIEIYGNDHNLGINGTGNWLPSRGGKVLAFFNKLTNSVNSAMYSREEYSDNLWPVGTYDQHSVDSYYWSNISTKQGLIPMQISATENCCSIEESWQAGHAYPNLFCANFSNDAGGNCWKQWRGSCISGSVPPVFSGINPRYETAIDGTCVWLNLGNLSTPIALNENVWTQTSSGLFDGTGNATQGGGVGCGPLSARPSTCTVGVGYWATSQSCSDLSGMVGKNPVTPISGTLYKCTAPDTWTEYYTPYTYPHPLRSEVDIAPPAAPQGLSVQ